MQRHQEPILEAGIMQLYVLDDTGLTVPPLVRCCLLRHKVYIPYTYLGLRIRCGS